MTATELATRIRARLATTTDVPEPAPELARQVLQMVRPDSSH